MKPPCTTYCNHTGLGPRNKTSSRLKTHNPPVSSRGQGHLPGLSYSFSFRDKHFKSVKHSSFWQQPKHISQDKAIRAGNHRLQSQEMVYLPLNENSIGSWKTRSDRGLQNEYTTIQSPFSLFKVLQFPCLYPTYSFWKCLWRTGRWLITRALLREATLQETFCAQCHPQTPAASGLEKLCGSPEMPAIYVCSCRRQGRLKWPTHHHFVRTHLQKHRKHSRQWMCWGSQHQKFTWRWCLWWKWSRWSRQNGIICLRPHLIWPPSTLLPPGLTPPQSSNRAPKDTHPQLPLYPSRLACLVANKTLPRSQCSPASKDQRQDSVRRWRGSRQDANPVPAQHYLSFLLIKLHF